jgi:tetratricopeptide (TPR) repeat protein
MRIIRLFLSTAILATALSCGQTDLGRQFKMERALNSANRLKTQSYIGVKRLDDARYRQLENAYREITEMVPPPPEDSAAIKQASDALNSCWQLAGIAFYNLGLLKMEGGDYQGAFDDFQTLIGRYGFRPQHVRTALMMQAAARLKQDRFEEAVLLYNRAAEYYLTSGPPLGKPEMEVLEAPLIAARILDKTEGKPDFDRQLDYSIRYYWNILNSYGNSRLGDAAIGNLAQAFLMGDRADSAVAILSAVRDPETGKNPPLVLVNIASIQLNNLKDPSAAEKTYRVFLETYPEHRLAASARLGLGTALFSQGQFENARMEISTIGEDFSASDAIKAKADYLGALCLEKEGRWERALGEFQYIAAEYPATAWGMEAVTHVAEYYKANGNERLAAEAFKDADEHYRKLMDLYEARVGIAARAMSYLARSLTLQEKWEDAADVLSSLAVRYPGTAEGYSSYLPAADILAGKLNRPAEAAALLRIFARNYPGDENIGAVNAYADSLERAAG